MSKRLTRLVAAIIISILSGSTPAMASSSLAFQSSGITNSGLEAGYDLSQNATVVARLGASLDSNSSAYLNGQVGARRYLNAGGPLRAFVGAYIGVGCLFSLNGSFGSSAQLLSSVGGGAEYRLDSGAFLAASVETPFLGDNLLTGYSLAFRVGKRF